MALEGELDTEKLMAMLRKHFNPGALAILTVTRWKDGIDLEFPTLAIEAFAADVRPITIKECAGIAENNEPDGEIRDLILAELSQ